MRVRDWSSRWAAAGAVFVALLAAPSAHAGSWSPCPDFSGLRCTTVSVPLDRSGTVAGRIGLRVAHMGSGPAGQPLLYLAGGPGDAGVSELIDVAFGAPELARAFDLYGFDQRGTGRSGLLRCPALERDPRLRSTRAGADCARRLGVRGRFYTTAESVEDVEAVRAALGVPKLTLLAISYGTKLALAYARVHPEHVQRLVLDSVVDPDDADPFARDGYRAIGPSLQALCPGPCVSRDPGTDLAALSARLRRLGPMRRAVYDAHGRRLVRSLTPLALSDLLFDADYDSALRAGVPAAVRAALDHGDAAPLLRLIEASAPFAELPSPAQFSAGRYAASCEETPLPWDPAAPPARRASQARVAALGAGALAPFDFDVVHADVIDLCLGWPRAGRAAPSEGGAYPALPTLILQGGEDLRTPPAASARVAAAIPGAARVVVPGVGHAVLSGDRSGCGLRSVLAFVADRPVGPTCPRVATGVPATGFPPASLGDVEPLAGVPRRVGQTAAAVRATLDDLAFSLSPALGQPAGGGLRGGRYRGVVLHALEVVRGVRLTGGRERGGLAYRVLGPAPGRVRLSPGGTLRGWLGGTRISVSLRGTPAARLATRAPRLAVQARLAARAARLAVPAR